MKCCMIISVMSLILSLLQEGAGVGCTPVKGSWVGRLLPFLDLPQCPGPDQVTLVRGLGPW